MNPSIPFKIYPDVSKYQTRIKETKHAIGLMLDKVMLDFIMISSIFKKYNQYASNYSQPSHHRISYIVKELQYIDAFTQKLDHIIELNNQIIECVLINEDKIDDASFIFHLNHLQAYVSRHEFITTIKDVHAALIELHDHIIEVTKIEYNADNYFQNREKVEGSMNQVINLLEDISRERLQESPLVSYDKSNLALLSNLYTVESERYVLVWLANNLNCAKEDLLNAFVKDGFGRPEEEIELF